MLKFSNLYYIAIIPHRTLNEVIKGLKEELKTQFDTKSALKSPAHITLQKPFNLSNDQEPFLIDTLIEFAKNQHPFNIQLNGFGCFSPRVIFIDIVNPKPVLTLHLGLKKILKHELDFKSKEISSEIYPHITIATRDLTKENFAKAWPSFQFRKFKASFIVKSLFLLKHNGKFWDVYKEFPFKN